MATKRENKIQDTGLRGRPNGELYVDKKIFFKRTDVRKVINSLKDSEILKEHLSQTRKELAKAQ